MIDINNFPFKNMPISNGSYASLVFFCLFSLITNNYTFMVFWVSLFSISVLIDTVYGKNSRF